MGVASLPLIVKAIVDFYDFTSYYPGPGFDIS
jgi:hypothetical protein